jgi:hypothetical protein
MSRIRCNNCGAYMHRPYLRLEEKYRGKHGMPNIDNLGDFCSPQCLVEFAQKIKELENEKP